MFFQLRLVIHHWGRRRSWSGTRQRHQEGHLHGHGPGHRGVDIGIKDYREVLVFHDKATLTKFIDSGWEFAGTAEASAAVAGQRRHVAKGEGAPPITVYPMTRTGLSPASP